MKIETIDGKTIAHVYVQNGELPAVLGWFERTTQEGTLTALLERGIERTYTRRDWTTARPQERPLTTAQLVPYRTAEYAWNNGR